jgi:threonine dehydrogenase-like Zn-dependent dehydrogenase
VEAAVFRGPFDIRLETVADPRIEESTDAIVRILASGICGSDLWSYRGLEEAPEGQVMGHEWLGVVEDLGTDVDTLDEGDVVVAPFAFVDGTCAACRRGQPSLCEQGGAWGWGLDVGGGQAPRIRAVFADATLVKLPAGSDQDASLLARVLPLTDVLPTGHYAAVCAGVGPGATVAIVGDGAVGLCAVLAARRLGADRVFLLGRHEDRLRIGERFGADAVLRADDAGIETVRDETGGGADAVLECVGTQEALDSALRAVRDGGALGYVGMPATSPALPVPSLFERAISFRGGFAPARAVIPELLPDVLEGSLDASPVFTHELDLASVADGYRLMHEREAVKVLLRAG